jgi:hypothetical protein
MNKDWSSFEASHYPMKMQMVFIVFTLCSLVVNPGCVTVRTSIAGGNSGGELESTSRQNLTSTPAYRDVKIPKDVVGNLPKDYALSFLQSLNGPAWWANSCRFDSGGVTRSAKKGSLPGKHFYSSLNMSFVRSGSVELIAVFVNKTEEVWCLIEPRSIAKQKATEVDSLTAKIYTSLLSMGVTITPSRTK